MTTTSLVVAPSCQDLVVHSGGWAFSGAAVLQKKCPNYFSNNRGFTRTLWAYLNLSSDNLLSKRDTSLIKFIFLYTGSKSR